MAGAIFGEVQVSLFLAGAVFGEVQVSLFVAGTVFGETWNDSRSAKCSIFQYKKFVVSAKCNLGCEAEHLNHVEQQKPRLNSPRVLVRVDFFLVVWAFATGSFVSEPLAVFAATPKNQECMRHQPC